MTLKKTFIGSLLAIFLLVLSSCTNTYSIEQSAIATPTAQQLREKLDVVLAEESDITEAASLDEYRALALPSDIQPAQLNKVFRFGPLALGLVIRPSANFPLAGLESGKSSDFSGIVIADVEDSATKSWEKLLQIEDVNYTISGKNNPYYISVDNQKLTAYVVDHNGAGSGEGMMKVFGLEPKGEWVLSDCYYFSYLESHDVDYFADAAILSNQKKQPLKMCENQVTLTTFTK